MGIGDIYHFSALLLKTKAIVVNKERNDTMPLSMVSAMGEWFDCSCKAQYHLTKLLGNPAERREDSRQQDNKCEG